MNQWVRVPMKGQSVSRAIYSPPVRFQRSRLPEVVRQITWEAEQDRERCKDQLLTWPTIAVEFYEIADKEDWSRADSALRKLEKCLDRFPFDGSEAPGLSLMHPDYTPGEDLWHRRYHEIVGRNAYVRTLYLQLSWGGMEATFPEGQDSDFDSAWEEAWDALSQICRPELQVQSYEEYYFVQPERLSQLLTRAVG